MYLQFGVCGAGKHKAVHTTYNLSCVCHRWDAVTSLVTSFLSSILELELCVTWIMSLQWTVMFSQFIYKAIYLLCLHNTRWMWPFPNVLETAWTAFGHAASAFLLREGGKPDERQFAQVGDWTHNLIIIISCQLRILHHYEKTKKCLFTFVILFVQTYEMFNWISTEARAFHNFGYMRGLLAFSPVNINVRTRDPWAGSSEIKGVVFF